MLTVKQYNKPITQFLSKKLILAYWSPKVLTIWCFQGITGLAGKKKKNFQKPTKTTAIYQNNTSNKLG